MERLCAPLESSVPLNGSIDSRWKRYPALSAIAVFLHHHVLALKSWNMYLSLLCTSEWLCILALPIHSFSTCTLTVVVQWEIFPGHPFRFARSTVVKSRSHRGRTRSRQSYLEKATTTESFISSTCAYARYMIVYVYVACNKDTMSCRRTPLQSEIGYCSLNTFTGSFMHARLYMTHYYYNHCTCRPMCLKQESYPWTDAVTRTA